MSMTKLKRKFAFLLGWKYNSKWFRIIDLCILYIRKCKNTICLIDVFYYIYEYKYGILCINLLLFTDRSVCTVITHLKHPLTLFLFLG